jgi:hypothetical protein
MLMFGTLALLLAQPHPRTVLAQDSRTGAILDGTVHDASGAVIPSAAVTIRNASTDQSRALTTDEQGFFRAQELAVGTYEVRVDHPGLAAYRQTDIELSLGQTLHLEIVLAVASASSELTVRADVNAIEPTQTSVVSSVDQERIEELPVRSRNYLDFVLLAPGVVSSPNARSARAGAAPAGGTGFTFGGLRSRSNYVSVDGLDNNDEYLGASRIELSPEIVQEFQVVNNGLSAESGGAAGGSINVITRSGTNTIHGDAFLFAQDSFFNARDPFESDAAKPSDRRFRAGFALGGPIVKGKTFYYAAAEQEHDRGEYGSEINRAATLAINSFLASGALPGLGTRSITTSFSPMARAETEVAGKLNHQLTSATALALRYAFTNNKEAGNAFGSDALTDASARGSDFTSDNSVSGSLTTLFGSTAVSDFRFQASTRRAVLRANQPLGPEIVIAGLATFGRAYAGDSTRRENHYQANYTYTRTASSHHLWKIGGAVNRVRLRADVPDGFASVYLFGSLADFLAGAPGQFRQTFGNPHEDFAVIALGAFLQDHWSPFAHLAIDAGLRYDYESLPSGFPRDGNNVSPRIGLAWNPSQRWVFRAGYGIFSDRQVLANLTRAVVQNGIGAFQQIADSAAAANVLAAARGGPLAAPAAGITPSIFRADPRMRTPYSQQTSAGAEYLIAKNLTLRGDYLFVRGVKLPRTTNVNLLPPVILTLANAASLGVPNPQPQDLGREIFSSSRSNPQFADIYQIADSANSTYQGVSFTFSRKMNEDLEFSASYTLSKSRDDASEYDEQPQNPFDPTAEAARSLQNQRHTFVFNALWELPIGDDEDKQEPASRNPGWLTRTFSHLELAPIFMADSGRPVNPITGVDSNRSHAFPLSSRPLGFARNDLQTPALVTMDLRLVKYFPFGGVRRLDVVAESFNLFNRPNVAQLNPVFGTSSTPIAGFGAPIEGTGARQLQFSLDFEF